MNAPVEIQKSQMPSSAPLFATAPYTDSALLSPVSLQTLTIRSCSPARYMSSLMLTLLPLNAISKEQPLRKKSSRHTTSHEASTSVSRNGGRPVGLERWDTRETGKTYVIRLESLTICQETISRPLQVEGSRNYGRRNDRRII